MDATQQIRLGMNICHGEQYWQGVVGSIAMTTCFLNYICCSSFIQLEQIILNVVHLIQRLSSNVISCVECPFCGDNRALCVSILQNISIGKSVGS